MLFERQKALLSLLDAFGGEVGNLDFQKLLFLYCMEEDTPTYEFVPYKYGGFSFTSYADRRRLVERGLLHADDRTWKLTRAGASEAAVSPKARARMIQFSKHHTGIRGDALVALAYQSYPYYAIRSEIAERVLADSPASFLAVAAARPSVSVPGLWTIGYEGRTLEGYLNQLLRAGITLLCDVRRNPLSRKYGFSKNTLSNGCDGVGIQYEHISELGIESSQRRNLETQADYDALFAQYQMDSLPRQHSNLLTIRNWIKSGACVALTCYERLPEQCHRHCVAEALEKEFGPEFTPRHL